MLRRSFVAAALATLLSLPALGADEHFVATTQIVEHPALDACRQGVQDELRDRGFVAGTNLKWVYESAQGNPATASQVARKFAGEKPDVIVAIATPSAIAAAAAARDIPIVFSAVTDPVGAKLVQSLEHPGGLVTGTTDMLPIPRHIDLIRRARGEIQEALGMTSRQEAMDFIEVNVKAAFDLLGEITGQTAGDEILEEIFSCFCLGK